MESLRTPEGVKKAWKATVACRLIEREEELHATSRSLPSKVGRPSLGEDDIKGYRFVKNAISIEFKRRLITILHGLFAHRCWYHPDEERGDGTHTKDGLLRITLKLPFLHFERMCADTVKELDHPDQIHEPFNALLGLAWEVEVTPSDIDFLILYMQNIGKPINSVTATEFQGMLHRQVMAPQMFHCDTNPLEIGSINVVIPLGGSDDAVIPIGGLEYSEDRVVGDSTHIVLHTNVRFADLSKEEKRKRIAYLLDLWRKVKRILHKTKVTLLSHFTETLTEGLEYVSFPCGGCDAIYFVGTQMHRAPPQCGKKEVYRAFLSYSWLDDDITTDGDPIHEGNYKFALQWSSEDDSDGDDNHENGNRHENDGTTTTTTTTT
jgi:hypothetical protein